MNLCIDIGNSAIKVCIFKQNEIVHSDVFKDLTSAEFRNLLGSFPAISAGIISSVRYDNDSWIELCNQFLPYVLLLDAKTAVPVVNLYDTPETLGKDRLAAVIGANFLYPDQDILVIDAGSAITFDFINRYAEYEGGNISPGLSMRFRALHEFTSKLPLEKPDPEVPFLGKNTRDAIVSGVQNGLLFEAEFYIKRLLLQYPDMKTLVTGGNSAFLHRGLSVPCSLISGLVPVGLNTILNYNRPGDDL